MNLDNCFVFDTNVLVSAFLFKKGIPRAALEIALEIGLIVRSDETLGELWEVLVRPKFDRFYRLATEYYCCVVLKRFPNL
jgi:predicted nucleic acid-binding protein